MARNSSDRGERSIPHLRDIFWHGGGAHDVQPSWRRQHDVQHAQHVTELAFQFQNDARISSIRTAKEREASKHSKHASDLGNDSAISVGSTSEDEVPVGRAGKQPHAQQHKKCKKSRRDTNARTLTERDVKHLERHLSMKKTIRKKIMRDLQQAFVEDPNEFRVEDISQEQLIQSLSFGAPGQGGHAESNFLDMLRSNGGLHASHPNNTHRSPSDDQDSGHGSPRGSTRSSPTRELSVDVNGPPGHHQSYHHHHPHHHASVHRDEHEDCPETGKKTSFWRRFTMKKNKR